ncbi:MAG: glycosyltransferase family 4 protein [Candidatus Bathyarchaeota archaeon]|nr:glycosyltransferase family 4 protein [Candidatus Bathyarchaeota archaeon]
MRKMPEMKIAQVCPRYEPYIGGVETHVKQISERLVRIGYAVEVLTTDSSGQLPLREEINGVIVRRFKAWSPNESYYFSRHMQRYLVENSKVYDLIHAHSYHAFTTYYAAQAKKGGRLVFTPRYHGGGHTFFRNLLHKPYKLIGKKVLKDSDKIICLSQYEKSLLLSNFKVDERKVLVIPNGVVKSGVTDYRTGAREKNLCKKILCVSRIEKYKGIQYVIKALPKVGKDVHLEIVGKGPYKRDLVNLVHSMGLENEVSFYQGLKEEELVNMRSTASVFVLLSQHEAFGNAVAEALSSTIPCIVANVSALQEWVDNRICYGLEYPIDVGQLANLISVLIEKRVTPTNLYAWDDTVNELTEVYENI